MDFLSLSSSEHRELIGKGGFGRVFKVFHNLDNQYYAIKQIRVSSNQNVNTALKEVRIMASISHPHIVRYHYSWISTTPYQDDISSDDSDDEDQMVPLANTYFFNIQMEYCPSSMRTYLIERQQLDVSIGFEMMSQITKGLCFLHKHAIVHRDLKPENVLIASFQPLQVKITDFGLASWLYADDSMTSSYGSYLYSAPEHSQQKSMDIYSMGIMMFEIQHLFSTDMERIYTIQALKQRKDVTCPYFQSLILNMTDTDPQRRPSIQHIYHHYFMDLMDPVVICRDIVWQIVTSI